MAMERSDRTPGFGWGSISANGDECMPLREAAKRLGLARKALLRLRRAGLRTFKAGGQIKLVWASDLAAVLRKIADAEGRAG
jgi:hypothetical protein